MIPLRPTKRGWTEERIALLKTLWQNDGLSASEIAGELGVTRNSVIGKLHRLGLTGRDQPTSVIKRRPRQRRTCARTIFRTARSTAEKRVELPAPVMVAPVALGLTLDQLTHDACRFPIGDPRTEGFCFCGHPTAEGLSYCPYHCGIAYQADSALSFRRRASDVQRGPATVFDRGFMGAWR